MKKQLQTFLNIFKTSFLFLFNKFRARKILYLTFLVVPMLFFVPFWWIPASLLLGRIVESIYIATYHEFHVHKLLVPRCRLVEILGYWRICAGDFQSPGVKSLNHWKHHRWYKDTEHDPTQAKLHITNNPFYYLLDLGKHAPHYHLEVDEIKPVKTSTYNFFEKYWLEICLLNLAIWLIFVPFWTFVCWFILPVWFWGVVWRSVDWWTHKLGGADKDWLVFVYGSQCWHHYHHDNVKTQTDPYYGKGIWKIVNIDCWSQKLTFKKGN